MRVEWKREKSNFQIIERNAFFTGSFIGVLRPPLRLRYGTGNFYLSIRETPRRECVEKYLRSSVLD